MEQLARELKRGIDIICGMYHYQKDESVLLKAKVLAERMQEFCSSFLQGNIYGMEEEEYQSLYNYVLMVLEDYLEALKQQDMVYMLDTLDYGLRELVDIFIEENEDAEEAEDE